MADDIDRAQEREELDRALAVAAARGTPQPSRCADADGDLPCIECGQAIEPARVQALRGCVTRCYECAQDHEHRMRTIA